MDQFYFEEGYLVQGYHVYVAEASVSFGPFIVEGYLDSNYFEERGAFAALSCIAQIVVGQQVLANGAWSSNFSLSVGISKLVSTSADLTSAFTQNTIATRNSDIDLFAFSDAAISIQVQRIRDNNITASSAFNIAVDGARVRNIDSAEDALFSFNVVSDRSRDFILETQAAFSLSATIDGTVDEVTVNLSSSFSVYANGGFTFEYDANLRIYSNLFASRNIGKTGRPRNLITNLVNSTPAFSTTRKFGSHSLSPESNALNNGPLGQNDFIVPFQNEDFFLETWYYPTANESSTSSIFQITNFFAIQRTNNFFRFDNVIDNPNVGSPNIVGFYRYTHTTTFALNQWHHLAVVKQGNSLAYYINGTRVYYYNPTGETVPFYRWGSDDIPNYSATIQAFSRNGFVDESFYVKGNTYGYSTSASTLSVPTSPRQNGPNVICLYHFDNNVNDDVSLVQTASAGLTSVSAISGSANGSFGINSVLQSTATLSATISHIEGADLTAFGQALLTVEILRIQQLEIDLESQFSVSCQDSKVTDIESNQSCNSSVNVEISAIRNAQIATEALATQLTAVVRLAGLFADDVVTATLSADAVVTRSAVSLSVSNASIVTDNFRVRFNSINAVSEFTNVVQGFVGVVGASDMSGVFAQTADANRFRDNTVTLNAVSELSATGNNLGKIEGALFDAVSMTIVAVKITSASATANTTAAVTANTDISLTKTYQSAMSAEFTDSFIAEKRVGTFAFLTAFASKLTVAVKQTVTDLDVNVVSTMSVSAVKTTSVTANFANTTTQSTIAVKTARAISNQSSDFAQTITAIKAVFGSADLSAFAFELVAAVKTAGISISTNTAATMTVSAVKTASINSSLDSSATVTATILRIRSAQSSLNSNFAQSSTVGYLASAEITIASAMTFVSEVREIHIEEIVYVIPGEIWEYEITSETRLQVIGSESREYIIT